MDPQMFDDFVNHSNTPLLRVEQLPSLSFINLEKWLPHKSASRHVSFEREQLLLGSFMF